MDQIYYCCMTSEIWICFLFQYFKFLCETLNVAFVSEGDLVTPL